jgi:hypothetical protein
MAKINEKMWIVEHSEDIEIKAIREDRGAEEGKLRLFLDVDGTLVAMIFNPNFGGAANWESVHRTDFCHWINSIYSVLNKFCDIYVLTNYSIEQEKDAKIKWLADNLKCDYKLILNKEGITKSLYVRGAGDILVDDTLRNLAEWAKAGGTQIAYQWVTCEKGRRELLEKIVK